MYALVDANSFYCSAEQVFRPDWRNRPIVVLSNNDGCIVAANRLAKEAGISKFGPYFEANKLCEQKGIIALSSNYELYGSLSTAMMEVIGRFAPEQHIYSIDESFLSFKHCYPAISCLTQHALKLRRAVWKETRLPVCVGIGSTLTLAKVANHAAKKIAGYNGVCTITCDEQLVVILKTMKTDDVWGVGRKIAKRLAAMNIHNAFALSQMKPGIASKQFSIELERTVRELNGEVCKTWDEARADKKQIFSTRSVGNRVTDLTSLCQALSKHASTAAAKARSQGSLCKSMLIFASNSPFDEQPGGFKFVHHFNYPTNDTCELIEAATRAAIVRFNPAIRYYKIGVGLINLCSETNLQQDLFESCRNPNRMQVLDSINAKYGTDSLFLAAQGISQKWGMRREMLTPQYTTRWRDIPSIKC
ncbi:MULTISPECIES: Y-family DNA polymerase [unclassified Shewanella]|uniref:Y-family DNA polymerase n=1 Tax=unclassified Shewanella TaxID=196818 RepID=UPI001BC04FD7|nr:MULTISPECIES: Y-family DNA polymerase [unclassified Shewanella]GIU10731.1 DNA polymerase V subunit UmuC [Shewanella sp. MBTL60-112-B1]GIU32855.1 DNA polymerase V subunit UmuC [Shewanella sp. MBTL60-112-B2]